MTSNLPRPGIVINADIIDSSPGGHPRHAALINALEAIFTKAIEDAPVPDPWARSSRGDGEVIVAPANLPAAWLVADCLNSVYRESVGYNRGKLPEARLRMRLGIHSGDVLLDDLGAPLGGETLVWAARLQASPAAREASVRLPEAPVIAVLSDEVYERVVPYSDRGLRAEEFRKVRVRIADEKVRSWLHVPHFPPPDIGGAPGVARPRKPKPKPKPRPSAPPAASKYSVEIIKSRDFRVGDNLGTETGDDR